MEVVSYRSHSDRLRLLLTCNIVVTLRIQPQKIGKPMEGLVGK